MFTEARIAKLRAKQDKYDLFEGHGFGIRVRPTGSKSWIFAYRFKGRSRMMTLGRHPQMTLLEARIEHARARDDLARHIDPGVEKVAQNEQERQSASVQELVRQYIDKWAKPHKRTWAEDSRVLHKDVIPLIGHKKVRDITRQDVIGILDAVSARGATIQTNRTKACISKMFSFALERGLVEFNPCARITKNPENTRQRILTDAEVKQFWKRLDGCAGSAAVRTMTKLLLLTGQRKSEIAGMKWDEIDGTWWTIPGDRTKNKRPHRVYLTKNSRELIDVMPKRSEYVFPSRVKDGHLTARMVNDVVYNCQNHLGLKDFVPHDLRRTMSTAMARSGVSEYVIGRVLNHTDSSVTGRHYNAYSYEREKREAMIKWERHIAHAIGKPVGLTSQMFEEVTLL